MKTVITASGNQTDALFDSRFGRASHFCVVDELKSEIRFVINDNKDAQGGAGTKAAENMAELGVSKVISGHFGPKAQELLDKLNIQMVTISDESATVQDIINKISNQ
ncbi:dinitrogenase iron-molybdenum cofactor biosynthesis protein [bacterium]|nr:dinitrogenase iron-molybdenum cofactor biosynthesis protein [bacterium]